MGEKKNSGKYIQMSIIGYILAVLIYQAFYLVLPFRYVLTRLHLTFLSPLLAVVGFALLLWDTITDRTFLKMKESLILIGILCTLLVSVLLNYQYGFIDSVKSFIWQSVQMLLLFPACTRLSSSQWSKMLKRLYYILSAVLFPACLISLAQFFLEIGYIVPDVEGSIRQGFLEGRLFGLFTSTHYSSVLMVMMLLASIYCCIKSEKKFCKFCYGLIGVVYFVVAVLSGTRSVIVALAVSALPVTFVYVLKRGSCKQGAKMVLTVLKGMALAVAAAAMVVCAFWMTDKVCKAAVIEVAQLRNHAADDPGLDSTVKPPDELGEAMQDEFDDLSEQPTEFMDQEQLQDSLKRHDIDASNISNNRFKIWQNYLYAVSQDPLRIVFGASLGGYMDYVNRNFPDLYIVEHIKNSYPLQYQSGLIYDTHSAYIGAYAMGGLLGVLGLLLFIVVLVVKGIRYLVKNENIPCEFYVYITVLIFMLTVSFFDSDLFFRCTCTSVFFWFFSGFYTRMTGLSDGGDLVEKP